MQRGKKRKIECINLLTELNSLENYSIEKNNLSRFTLQTSEYGIVNTDKKAITKDTLSDKGKAKIQFIGQRHTSGLQYHSKKG